MAARFQMALLVLAIVTITSESANAGEISINLSNVANEPWTYVGPNDFLIINGSTFPTGSQNFGGIPFTIPTDPNNYWAAGAAANFSSGIVRVTIPVGVYGVTSAYTLMSSMWGWAGPKAYMYVTFVGSAGAVVTVPLVGNVNVRDYNQDGNTNSINNTSTVQVWDNGDGQRLDRQEYILPAAFATQVLTSVTITDTGNEGNGTNGSRAILAALTVSTCPEHVAEALTLTSTPIVYNASDRIYSQILTLTNTGTTAAAGPLVIYLEDLPKGVSLLNSAGPSLCFAPLGSPTVIELPAGDSLAPNTSVNYVVRYRDPSGAPITYTPLVVQ